MEKHGKQNNKQDGLLAEMQADATNVLEGSTVKRGNGIFAVTLAAATKHKRHN
jgi:hypothetical protein